MNTGRLFVLGIITALIVLLLVLAPDNNNQIDDIKPYVQSLALKDEMELCSETELKRDYGISGAQTDGFLLYETMDKTDPGRILVIKVREQKDADQFRRMLQKTVRDNISKTNANGTELLKNTKIITKGKFLFVIVSENSRDYIRILRSAIR